MSDLERHTPKEAEVFHVPDTVLLSNDHLEDREEVDQEVPWQTPEQLQADIRHKAEVIRTWARSLNLKEGKDFRIIESIRSIDNDTENIAPDEDNRFFVIIHETHYNEFTSFITGPYMEQRRREQPDSRIGSPRLDFSWAGRFAVGWDGATIDTAPATDVEHMTASTYHNKFREFYRAQTGTDFPTSETMNPILREIAEHGLGQHIIARDNLRAMREAKTLPYGGIDLLNELERTILIFNDALNGEAVVDLPETIGPGMPSRMRHYADLTYNAEHIQHLSNYDRIKELTGVDIPPGKRITDLFPRIQIDTATIDRVCREFSDSLAAERVLDKVRHSTS